MTSEFKAQINWYEECDLKDATKVFETINTSILSDITRLSTTVSASIADPKALSTLIFTLTGMSS